MSTPELKAYEDAMAQAWKAYNEATAPALEVYGEAMAQAWKAYEEAIAPARKARDEATAQALKTLSEDVDAEGIREILEEAGYPRIAEFARDATIVTIEGEAGVQMADRDVPVKIPDDLADEIREILEEEGYVSIGEFVRCAAIRRLEELEKEAKEKAPSEG